MAEPQDMRDEALQSFEQRLEALEEGRNQKARLAAGKSLSEGYRLVAGVIGGVLIGVGLGWLLDHFANTGPFGLVGGMLIGTGVSIYNVVRVSVRLSKQALEDQPAPAVPFDDDDD